MPVAPNLSIPPPLAPPRDKKIDDVCVAAGFEAHSQPLKSARMALDEISHELAPSQWLEERSADKKPAQQLGTLGGGNHFLEVPLFCLCFCLRVHRLHLSWSGLHYCSVTVCCPAPCLGSCAEAALLCCSCSSATAVESARFLTPWMLPSFLCII